MPILAHMARHYKLIQAHKKGLLLSLYTVGFVAYLVLGGFVFVTMEAPQEEAQMNAILNVKNKILAKYNTIPESALEELFQELESKGVKGLVHGNTTRRWTFANAILFSATLLTTIGYGHLSPSSELGKVTCLLYTGVGLPLTLVFLARYVDRLIALSDSFKANLFRRLKYWKRPFGVRLAHITIVMVFIAAGCFVLPAWVFWCLESTWTYLDCIYFCFISLTTVGLGDFVPANTHPHPELYRLGATAFLVVGVTVMMFMMAVAADFIHNFNNGYHALMPLVDDSEKTPIKSPPDPPSYGTIILHVEERQQNIANSQRMLKS